MAVKAGKVVNNEQYDGNPPEIPILEHNQPHLVPEGEEQPGVAEQNVTINLNTGPAPVPCAPPAAPPPPPVESHVYSVRMQASVIPIIESLKHLHFTLGHTANEGDSEYIKYLMMKDAETMRDEIRARRAKITG